MCSLKTGQTICFAISNTNLVAVFLYEPNGNGKNISNTVFICINAPGAMHFSKGGGATITDKKNQLSSPVAMGDNGHLQS